MAPHSTPATCSCALIISRARSRERFRSPDYVISPNHVYPKKKLWGSRLSILRLLGDHWRAPILSDAHPPTYEVETYQWRPSERSWTGKLSKWKRLPCLRRGGLNFYHERCGRSSCSGLLQHRATVCFFLVFLVVMAFSRFHHFCLRLLIEDKVSRKRLSHLSVPDGLPD